MPSPVHDQRSVKAKTEADTVRSHPSRAGYWAPSKAAVIDHLSTVHMRMHDPKVTPEKRQVLADDFDALLDRLGLWLSIEDTEKLTGGETQT